MSAKEIFVKLNIFRNIYIEVWL